MKTFEEVNKMLDEKIPRDVVSSRSAGGGMRLSYLETHYVIDRMNKVFGNTGWEYETAEMEAIEADKPTYRAKARIKAFVRTGENTFLTITKEGTGYGSAKSKVEPHELALKEAESDAFKRAAMKFGMSLGLALYSKEQENVDDGQPETAPPAAAKQTQSTASKPPVAETTSVPTQATTTTSREILNKLISSTAKVVLDMKKKTQAELEGMIKAFGKTKKEELTDEQANTLLNQLKETLK